MPARALQKLLERIGPDVSAEAIVPRFESRVAKMLGKEAAVLFPTGAMAQQVVLRVHADQRGRKTVAFHPQCHLEVHEEKGYAIVHGLVAALVGDRHGLIRLEDLEAITEPLAALLIELPQRSIGGQLPQWDDLVRQCAWARARGAAVHADGARLWEAQPFYGKTHAEIAALFDTIYVSLYKGLEAPCGALLAGPRDVVASARTWRKRLGGSAQAAWPIAALGELGLDELVPRMPAFSAHARAICAALENAPGVHVVPDPPQTPLFHVHLAASAEAVTAAATAMIKERGVHLFIRAQTATSPRACFFEVVVGENAMQFTPGEVRELVGELLSRAGQ
jgi:threonine aldolase